MNTERVVLRAPPALVEALDLAARKQMANRSEYARAAILKALRADGIDPERPTRQWALVSGGVVLEDDRGLPEVTPWLQHKPLPGDGYPAHRYPADAVWLPVEDATDREFDPTKHWKAAKPRYVVAGDRVLRVYQVVDKTLERA